MTPFPVDHRGKGDRPYGGDQIHLNHSAVDHQEDADGKYLRTQPHKHALEPQPQQGAHAPVGSKIVFSPGSLNVTGTIAVLFSFSPSYSAKITYFSPVSFRDTLTSLSDKNNIFVSVSFAIVLFILTISDFLPQTSVIVPVADPSAEAVAG